MANDRVLARTFDEDAELYDRMRPTYPADLVDTLVRVCSLTTGARVLEIGPGTGQLTIALLDRGLRVVALEPGRNLAAVLRRKTADRAAAIVDPSRFEEWPLPAEPFDAVVAATSFHWLDPAVRLTKAADVLRPGGALATITTHHVRGGDAGFFDASQACYERWDPQTPPGFRSPLPADIPEDPEEIERSGRFDSPVFRRLEHDIRYTTAEYLAVLMTYSGHRALTSDLREGLLRCIAELIESAFDGSIAKRYLFELRVARKRD
jgi:SAM-dependent methyltransferase